MFDAFLEFSNVVLSWLFLATFGTVFLVDALKYKSEDDIEKYKGNKIGFILMYIISTFILLMRILIFILK